MLRSSSTEGSTWQRVLRRPLFWSGAVWVVVTLLSLAGEYMGIRPVACALLSLATELSFFALPGFFLIIQAVIEERYGLARDNRLDSKRAGFALVILTCLLAGALILAVVDDSSWPRYCLRYVDEAGGENALEDIGT